MANPFLAAMGGAQQGPASMMQAFRRFMEQNQGRDPNEMLQQLLSSGQITQQPLTQAQQMARQWGGMLEGMRGMFGL